MIEKKKVADQQLEKKRHSMAHVMAAAFTSIHPDAKLGIGPAIENGFYYDFDLNTTISDKDLKEISKKMKKLISAPLGFEKKTVSVDEAKKIFSGNGEKYKLELIEDLGKKGEKEVSLYYSGDWFDLCKGPHVESTKELNPDCFILDRVSGAYWKGDEKNPMMQRIYGLYFNTKEELNDYLKLREEAKKRDHRKLGKELNLFLISDFGTGFPFFTPNGMVIKNELINYWREVHRRYNYVEIETPIILNRQLWETSGHWFHYRENMYTLIIDEQDSAIKPMNCPGGMLHYKSELHSYKEFPIRVGELGKVHRHELSGALHGLMRVRAFTQDDAHIFMLPEQIKDEIKNVIKLIDEIYQAFGFSYHLELSTRPENSMGSDEEWRIAEKGLQEAMDDMGLDYYLNEGDGAFYGPKIDFHLNDCIGRTWQCGTIQLDMQLPQRFNLEYIGRDGEKHRPVMIHRVAFGSIERFIGILIEHFEGKFPLWLSPEQFLIIPVSPLQHEYAKQLKKYFFDSLIRSRIDDREESLSKKIREARLARIPYIGIIGENEVKNGSITVRNRDTQQQQEYPKETVMEKMRESIVSREKTLNL